MSITRLLYHAYTETTEYDPPRDRQTNTVQGSAHVTLAPYLRPARHRKRSPAVAEGFRERFLKLAALMDEAEEDVLAYAAFPKEHWQKLWSNRA